MQLKLGIEYCFEKGNVEEVAAQSIVFGDWVSKEDTFVIGRFIDTLIVEEVCEIVIEKSHEFLNVERFGWALLR